MKESSNNRNIKKQKVQDVMEEVNQIIHSVFTMQLIDVENELNICSKIVGQLLHNDSILHVRSLPSLKLLIYELVLKLAERTQTSYMTDNSYSDNNYTIYSNAKYKIPQYNTSVCKVLHSARNLLEQIAWMYQQKIKTKSKTQKNINQMVNQPSMKISYYQKQLNNLIHDYQDTIHLQRNRYQKQQIDFDQQGHNALIQQLEDVISKKQQRIKQLASELERSLLDQRNMEHIIDRQQNQKEQTEKKIQILQEQINHFQQRHKFNIFQTEKAYSPNNMILSRSSDSNDYKENLHLNVLVKDNIDSQHFERLLLMQALSIEALIN